MAAAFYRLWAMSLQASFLILIVLIVRAFLGRYPRTYSYCLWLLVGIRLLCPLWVESPFSLQPDLSGYSAAAPEEQQGSVQLSKETDDMQPELERTGDIGTGTNGAVSERRGAVPAERVCFLFFEAVGGNGTKKFWWESAGEQSAFPAAFDPLSSWSGSSYAFLFGAVYLDALQGFHGGLG